MLADPDVPIGGLQQDPAPVSLPGADDAVLSCGDGCVAAMTHGGSITYLYLSDIYEVPAATAAAQAFAQAAFGA